MTRTKGTVVAFEVFPFRRVGACVVSTSAKREAEVTARVWRLQGKNVRTFTRRIRADGDFVDCIVLVVRHKVGGAR